MLIWEIWLLRDYFIYLYSREIVLGRGANSAILYFPLPFCISASIVPFPFKIMHSVPRLFCLPLNYPLIHPFSLFMVQRILVISCLQLLIDFGPFSYHSEALHQFPTEKWFLKCVIWWVYIYIFTLFSYYPFKFFTCIGYYVDWRMYHQIRELFLDLLQ